MSQVTVTFLDLKSYYPSPPFQLGLLAAYARTEEEVRRRIRFEFLEFARDASATAIAGAVLGSGADLVAVSDYAWNHDLLGRVLDSLDEAPGRVPRILVGGPNCAGEFGDRLLERFPRLSALIEGEGELGFRDVCASLADGPDRDPFDHARNVVRRGEDGGIVRRLPLHRVTSLDDVPSPYLEGILPVAPAPLFYETNRGCPYRCSFCYWGSGSAKIHRMSLERVREELDFFASRRVGALWLADANFGIFPEDALVAEMLVEVHERHGRPFRSLGVNWAKNSQERILEIAAILRRAGIGCTTTLALQSVTPEAERASRRYSLPAARFVGLVRAAEARDVDTYTDLIWGLPGEGVDDFLSGLEAVVSSGVPAIVVHQLHLLPGTEFYDRRRELGLVILSESDDVVPPASEASPYADFVVVRHPAMSERDMKAGTRLIGVNHVLHNHDLGRLPGLFLARHGVALADVYRHFDRLLLEPEASVSGTGTLFDDLRETILAFADSPGTDEVVFYRRLSQLVWFERERRDRRLVPREAESRRFFRAFFASLCRAQGLDLGEDERGLLDALVDLVVLEAPKPLWRPQPSYEFSWDALAVADDIRAALYRTGTGEGNWSDLAATVRARVAGGFGSPFLERYRRPVRYGVENPWRIAPSAALLDWLLSTRSKHCVVRRIH